MRWLVILGLCVVAAVADTTFAAAAWAPRCVLAVLALVLARWPHSTSFLLAAAAIGVIADTIDPGSSVFHAFFAMFMALLIMLIGERVRGYGILLSMAIAAGLVVLQAVLLVLLVNPAGWHMGLLLARLLTTVALAGILDLALRRLFRQPQRYLSPL